MTVCSASTSGDADMSDFGLGTRYFYTNSPYEKTSDSVVIRPSYTLLIYTWNASNSISVLAPRWQRWNLKAQNDFSHLQIVFRRLASQQSRTGRKERYEKRKGRVERNRGKKTAGKKKGSKTSALDFELCLRCRTEESFKPDRLVVLRAECLAWDVAPSESSADGCGSFGREERAESTEYPVTRSLSLQWPHWLSTGTGQHRTSPAPSPYQSDDTLPWSSTRLHKPHNCIITIPMVLRRQHVPVRYGVVHNWYFH